MVKRLWVVTLFPEYFKPLQEAGIVRRIFQGDKKYIDLHLINPRDFTTDNYQSVDDYVYGGGAGMLMRADILARAIDEGIIEAGEVSREKLHIIAPGPRGRVWNNQLAREVAERYQVDEEKEYVWICGRYEGIDERFLENYVDEHLSLGDFILSGGEIATLAMLDSFARFLPGVLGHAEGADQESFEDGLLEGPQYTRPPEFQGKTVPEVLTQGHHKKIEAYHLESRVELTKKHRPDLWEKYQLTQRPKKTNRRKK
jgi:tRNA (guanine37-N1)-methyltransferase